MKINPIGGQPNYKILKTIALMTVVAVATQRSIKKYQRAIKND